MRLAFCSSNLEKSEIKFPKTSKQGILFFLHSKAKYLARLLSTIVYKIITFCSDLHLEIILFIWFSVRVKEKWNVFYNSKLENWAFIAKKILSNVSPVESEI